MTEPNKELPKELESALGGYSVGQGGVRKGMYMAQSHYAPIIEAKDREIEMWMGMWEKVVAVNKDRKNQLSEKDATISKLMGLLKEQVEKDYITQKGRSIGWAEYCKSNSLTDLGGE